MVFSSSLRFDSSRQVVKLVLVSLIWQKQICALPPVGVCYWPDRKKREEKQQHHRGRRYAASWTSHEQVTIAGTIHFKHIRVIAVIPRAHAQWAVTSFLTQFTAQCVVGRGSIVKTVAPSCPLTPANTDIFPATSVTFKRAAHKRPACFVHCRRRQDTVSHFWHDDLNAHSHI